MKKLIKHLASRIDQLKQLNKELDLSNLSLEKSEENLKNKNNELAFLNNELDLNKSELQNKINRVRMQKLNEQLNSYK